MKLMSLLSVILGLIAGSGEQKDLQVEYFASLLGQGNVALVDVRTAEEYSAGHIPGATNVDFYSEDFLRLIEASIPKDCLNRVHNSHISVSPPFFRFPDNGVQRHFKSFPFCRMCNRSHFCSLFSFYK